MSSLNVAGLGQALFEESSDALFVFDPETDKLLDVNPMALKLTGFSRPQLLGRLASAVFRYDAPDDQQRLRQAAQTSRVFHSQNSYALHTAQENVTIPVHITVSRLHLKPKTLGLITARDLREQKAAESQIIESEARKGAILESVLDCIMTMDREGKITEVNPAAAKMFGHRRADMLGKQLKEVLFPPAVRETLGSRIDRYLPSGMGTLIGRRTEITAVRSNGQQFPAEMAMTVVSAKGHLVFTVYIRDITDRKLAEEALHRKATELEQLARSERLAHEELKRAQSQLVQAEKLAGLGQLVAGVAHEINNPLAFVSNNLAVLQRDANSLRELLRLYEEAGPLLAGEMPELHSRSQESAERIDLAYTLGNLDGLLNRSRDGLKRIQQIVKDLRDFARLDESDLHEVNLEAGILSTVSVLRSRAVTQNVELDVDLKPLPPVTCYPAKINQVVLNLVNNALDACPGGGKVTVRTLPVVDGVEIHVADTGTGIDPAIRAKIFDPFFTTKPLGQGIGLGLSISHGIVEEHGGRVSVESTPGQGSCFTVFLPLRPPSR